MMGDYTELNERIKKEKEGAWNMSIEHLERLDIPFEAFKERRTIHIGKQVFTTSNSRWRNKGSKKWYWSSGIDDFIERFYND